MRTLPRLGRALLASPVQVLLVVVGVVFVSLLTGPTAPHLAAQPQLRDQLQCDQHVPIGGNTIATTQLVALTAGQRIYVCGFVLQSAGITTAGLVRGTGSNCGTGTQAVTGLFAFTATPSAVPYGSGSGRAISLPVGEALCWQNTAAIQVSGVLSFTKL